MGPVTWDLGVPEHWGLGCVLGFETWDMARDADFQET